METKMHISHMLNTDVLILYAISITPTPVCIRLYMYMCKSYTHIHFSRLEHHALQKMFPYIEIDAFSGLKLCFQIGEAMERLMFLATAIFFLLALPIMKQRNLTFSPSGNSIS